MRRVAIRDLLPEDIILDLDGVEYPVPGAVIVPVIGRFIALQERLGDEESHAQALVDMYDLLMSVVRQRTPDAPDLPLTTDAMMSIWTILAGGDPDLQAPDETIADQLNVTNEGDAVPLRPVAAAGARTGAASAKRSPKRS